MELETRRKKIEDKVILLLKRDSDTITSLMVFGLITLYKKLGGNEYYLYNRIKLNIEEETLFELYLNSWEQQQI